MIKYFIIFTLFPLINFSQQSVGNPINKIKVRHDSNLIIQTNSSDILFIGTDNAFVLRGQNLLKYKISITNGNLTSIETLQNDTLREFNITVNDFNPTFVNISNGVSDFTYKFRNKEIPTPEVVLISDFGFINGGEISINKIKTVRAVSLILNGFDYNCAMRIVKYKLITLKNGITSELFFNNTSISYLKNPTSGEIYIFQDIVIEFQGSKEQRTLSPFTLIVK